MAIVSPTKTGLAAMRLAAIVPEVMYVFSDASDVLADEAATSARKTTNTDLVAALVYDKRTTCEGFVTPTTEPFATATATDRYRATKSEKRMLDMSTAPSKNTREASGLSVGLGGGSTLTVEKVELPNSGRLTAATRLRRVLSATMTGICACVALYADTLASTWNCDSA